MMCASRTGIAWTALTLVLGLLALGGCSGVTVSQPVGTPMAASEVEALAGPWIAGDQPLTLHHVGENELRVGWVEWKDDRFSARELRVLLTTQNEATYANVAEPEGEADPTAASPPALPRWSLARVTITDDAMIVYLPHADVWEKAVADGKLQGRVERSEHAVVVHVDDTKRAIDHYLNTIGLADHFLLDKPLVLRRLHR